MSHVDSAGALKIEPTRDGSVSSMGSPSSEPDLEPSPLEHATTPKRKGGRKPIYATSEERKQRNRQAQAAFRERRTEYIKQLETTIKHHEDALQSLQQSHRSAADECLMLRYKNSLLERILLEKGIDIQAELNAKSGSPHAGPDSPLPSTASTSKPSPIQRAVLNRHHHAQRSHPGAVLAVDPGHRARGPGDHDYALHSPTAHPTPPSQIPSPISSSSGFATQGVLTPPAPLLSAPPPPARALHPPPGPEYLAGLHLQHSSAPLDPHTAAMIAATTAAEMAHPGLMSSSTYYPGPFQNHIDQLEQEYDAQADLIDDPYPNEPPAGVGAQAHLFGAKSALDPPRDRAMGSAGSEAVAPAFTTRGELASPGHRLRHDDDPLGLWQSMTFPTPFSFPPSSTR